MQLNRETPHKGTALIQYFIASKVMTAEGVQKATRQHWHIENQLHWMPGAAFSEDPSRALQGYAAENLATARQITLNLLKQTQAQSWGSKKTQGLRLE